MAHALTYPVGIIGVGNMGGAMAANLLAHGWPVHVCDIDADKTQLLAMQGAVVHGNSAEIASQVSLLIICVVDGVQTQDVLFGLNGAAPYLKAGQAVMLCPTISPEDVEVCAHKLAAFGVKTMDAPMSGGPARAREGSMSLMRRAIAEDFEPRAHTTLLAKDTKLAVTAAQQLGFKASLGRVAACTFERALAYGLAGQDDASLIKLMRHDN